MSQALLDEAKTARHKLLTGTKVVSFNDGTSTVQYNQASLTKLEKYIEKLEASLDQPTRRRSPAGVMF